MANKSPITSNLDPSQPPARRRSSAQLQAIKRQLRQECNDSDATSGFFILPRRLIYNLSVALDQNIHLMFTAEEFDRIRTIDEISS